jgi:predicted phage terminase large subunit-like protein
VNAPFTEMRVPQSEEERRAAVTAHAIMLRDRELRAHRASHSRAGGLKRFVQYFWKVLEPETELVDGWPLDAICQHLEAVTHGQITRLLINVPPGFMKSLLVNVFWPAWEWGARGLPHLRYVTFSYAASLTERDNGRFRDLVRSPEYQELYGDGFELGKIGEVKVTNDRTGWKLASSVGGVGTGERGNRVLLDDPHNVKEVESDLIRTETVRWFRESMTNRLNDMEKSAIVIIMQRVHEADVAGTVLDQKMDYVHLNIPMEFEPSHRCTTRIGWSDQRKREGALAWPARFPPSTVVKLKNDLGPYAYEGQYQQHPVPRGGAIFLRAWWQLWQPAHNKYPLFQYVLASLDSAFTAQEENDPSALTVWGVWDEELDAEPDPGNPYKLRRRYKRSVMLMDAWRKHLPMHGDKLPRFPGEKDEAYFVRASPGWGLVEWVAYTCRRHKANKLLIESAASGITAAQEMVRLYGHENWIVHLVKVKGDKVARALSIVPTFTQGMVYRPVRGWAEMVAEEMATFPKGRYKDLTDSATQALGHLRLTGMLEHPEVIEAHELRQLQFTKPSLPLYPA